MTWSADPNKHEAMNEHGYRITWAANKHGTWFNGWSPHGTSVSGSYSKDKVKTECEAHHRTLEAQQAMRMAEKAATEVA
jgi:hypothetical protein